MKKSTVMLTDDAALERVRLRAEEAGLTVNEFATCEAKRLIDGSRESLHPIVQRWAGALPPMSDEEVDAALRDRRERKYGP